MTRGLTVKIRRRISNYHDGTLAHETVRGVGRLNFVQLVPGRMSLRCGAKAGSTATITINYTYSLRRT
jgi:hypothetical protein